MFIIALCWGRPGREALAMKLGQNTQRNSVPSSEKELEVLVVTIRPGSARLTGVCSALLTHKPGTEQQKIFVLLKIVF